jgi:hypothetical protein
MTECAGEMSGARSRRLERCTLTRGVIAAGTLALIAQGCHPAIPSHIAPPSRAERSTQDTPRPPLPPRAGALTAAERDSILRDVGARRAAWRARGVRDYRLRVAVDCFCPWPHEPRILEVRDGKAVALLDTTGRPAGALRKPWAPYTVEGMFDLLEGSARSADVLSARYDSRLGYPTEIRGDRKLGRADDWFSVTASNLTSRR